MIDQRQFDILNQTIGNAIHDGLKELTRPSVLHGKHLTRDTVNRWIMTSGGGHVRGIGNTPEDAAHAFDMAWGKPGGEWRI